jgi:hypothetical protein
LEIETEQEVYLYLSLEDIKKLAEIKTGEVVKVGNKCGVTAALTENGDVEISFVDIFHVDVDMSDYVPDYSWRD